MKNKFIFIPLIALSFYLTACPFSFGDKGEWKKMYGTPELLLENAKDQSYVYLYEDKNQFKDENNVIREAIKNTCSFESNKNKKVPNDLKYFTYEASWIPATSGPNYDHLSIWENGFVRIDHKPSLGFHEYLYFSIDEVKALELVNFVFLLIENE